MAQALPITASLAQQQTVYRSRRPQQTDLYRLVQQHFMAYLEAASAEKETCYGLADYAERTFREYLRCGIPAYGFARAHCDTCGHQYLIAFSCKGRGLCPSCGAKYMSATAAHLVDNVLPRVPYRQWVLSLPKRIRYFALHDARHAAALQRIFLKNIERSLRRATAQAAGHARAAAVSFIQRFGASLNQHLHFHSIVADGFFALAEDEAEVMFFESDSLTTEQLEQLTTKLRSKILRYMVKHDLLDEIDEKEMLSWQGHGGFSVDANVRIEAYDRLALERLVRYCARPPFAESRLTYIEPDRVVYRLPQRAEEEQSYLSLNPNEFINRVAQFIPPPRKHRNVYFGAIAAHAKLRPYVIKSAGAAATTELSLNQAAEKMGLDTSKQSRIVQPANTEKQKTQKKRKASRAWAMLIARIFEVIPLLCIHCKQPMKIIALVTEPKTVKTLLNAIGEDPVPPQLAQARAPPEQSNCINQETDLDYNQAPTGW